MQRYINMFPKLLLTAVFLRLGFYFECRLLKLYRGQLVSCYVHLKHTSSCQAAKRMYRLAVPLRMARVCSICASVGCSARRTMSCDIACPPSTSKNQRRARARSVVGSARPTHTARSLTCSTAPYRIWFTEVATNPIRQCVVDFLANGSNL